MNDSVLICMISFSNGIVQHIQGIANVGWLFLGKTVLFSSGIIWI